MLLSNDTSVLTIICTHEHQCKILYKHTDKATYFVPNVLQGGEATEVQS